jgi:hypothetical protein
MGTILANERKDWIFIILSSISGFLLVSFYLLIGKLFPNQPEIALLITFLIYAIFFDVRHLFSTYSRTYLDKTYFNENKRWLNLSFAFIILIPLLALLLISRGDYFSYNTGIVFTFLLRITTILGFYHLIKQNWGFMAIYKKKMNEPQDNSDKWEKMMLLSGSFIPFVIAAIIYPVWFPSEQTFIFPEPHLKEYIAEMWNKIALSSLFFSIFLLLVGYAFNSLPQYKYVSRNLGLFFFATFVLMKSLLHWETDTLFVILFVIILLFLVATIMSIRKAIEQKLFNKKKWAVLISSLVLYGGILLLPIENKSVVVMAITIPHNIQYLTFVNFFNSKFYSTSKKEHGLAKRMAQKVSYFIVVSFLYSVLYESFRTGTKYISFGTPEVKYIVGNVIAVFFLSMSLHHYYLDAVIWRVRKDKEIRDTV